ncbi:MAG: NAD-dependent deacylase [Armatimonadota bacterium]|nr:NAD-dependent deacylase [Armatimonadota bacterium]
MSVEAAAGLLRSARRAVALTGAGISTASGLPDFRSAGGLWAGVDPFAVATRTALQRQPEAFYAFYRQRLARLADAAPNPAHAALAAMEQDGYLHAVITQNVDGLHQAAGSRAVIEIHGNLREAVCIGCGQHLPIQRLLVPLEAGTLPRCGRCGALLKPNVVLFEDLLPEDAWARAMRTAQSADVMLVVGSSLQVYPAASLPGETLDRGGRLIIVNLEPTPYDHLAAVTIRREAVQVLPQIADAVRG